MSDIRRPAGLSRQHPEHGCTDLLRYSVPSQGLFPLFTELHTTAQRRQAACRSIRVFVTPHAGSDGNFTRQISAKFNSFRVMNWPVLLRISAQVVRQQSAHRPRTARPGRRSEARWTLQLSLHQRSLIWGFSLFAVQPSASLLDLNI